VLKIEYSKISIQPDKSKTTCQIFVWDLFNSREQNEELACKVFSLVEIASSPNRKINDLVEDIFGEIKPISSQNFLGKTPENFFENLVQRINYKYVELVDEEGEADSADWPPKINALLLLSIEKNIYFVQSGKIRPFLIYRTKPDGDYKIMDISENASGKENRANNINIFNNIVSGKINIGDYLLLTTESLLDYFSLEKLSNIISASSPREASRSLKELLAGPANPHTPFCSLIIKLKEEETKEKQGADSNQKKDLFAPPQHSMEKLLGTVADTEKFLTPSMHMNLGSTFFNFFEKVKTSLDRKENAIKNISQHNTFKIISKISKKIVNTIALLARDFFYAVFSVLKFLFIIATNKNGERRVAVKSIPKNLKTKINNIKTRFLSLSRSSQISLMVVVILFSIFLGTTVIAYSRYKNELALKNLNQRIEDIQTRKDLAEASIIYGDQITAVNSLREAEKLLTEFSKDDQKLNETYNNLNNDIQLLGEKIRNIKRITDLALIVDFKEENQETKLDKFILSKTSIIALGRESSSIYTYTIKDKKIFKKQTDSLAPASACLKDEDTVLLYGVDKKFFEFNPTKNSLKQTEVSSESNVDDMTIYNQKLYTVSSEANQVFKHSPTIVGFAKGTPWIKGEVNLENSKSIAVDGTIYVLKNSELIKLANGNKIDFSLTTEPALSAPTKIWTSSESSYLYIFEPSSKKIVVFDKQGKLKIQYLFEQLDNPKDFSVLEKEKKIYLLNGTQISGFNITHL